MISVEMMVFSAVVMMASVAVTMVLAVIVKDHLMVTRQAAG